MSGSKPRFPAVRCAIRIRSPRHTRRAPTAPACTDTRARALSRRRASKSSCRLTTMLGKSLQKFRLSSVSNGRQNVLQPPQICDAPSSSPFHLLTTPRSLLLRAAKALELFAAELVSKASAVAQNEHAKILQPSHIKACVETDDELSFLRDTVAKTPAPQAPKRKRPPAADRGGTASKRQGGGSHVGSGVAALSGGTSIAAGSSAASSHVLAETVADFIPPEDDDYDDF